MTRLAKWTFGSLVTALASFGIAAGISGGEGYPRAVLRAYGDVTFPKSRVDEKIGIPLEGRTEIVVETEAADVVFASGEAEAVAVELAGEMIATDDRRHLDLRFIEGVVHLSTRERPAASLKYPVSIDTKSPARLSVRLPTGFAGTLRVVTKTGSVSMKGGSLSELDVSTRTGAIGVEAADVHVIRFDSRSGEIVFDVNSQDVLAETISGPIRARLRDPGESQGSLVFRSKSGSIAVTVKREASLAVFLETASGEIENRASLGGRVETSDHRVAGDLGTGRGSLFARTWSGDITLATED